MTDHHTKFHQDQSIRSLVVVQTISSHKCLYDLDLRPDLGSNQRLITIKNLGKFHQDPSIHSLFIGKQGHLRLVNISCAGA